MNDVVFHIAIGIKNDRLTRDAGDQTLSDILQDKIENSVMGLPWVTDMLVSKVGEES
jgi:hypothetical protein